MKNKNILYTLDRDITIDYLVEPLDVRSIFQGFRQNNIRSHSIRYRSPLHTGIKENDTVYSELFVPVTKKERKNVIMLLHGFTSKLHSLDNYYKFIEEAAENGFPCLFINLPYHLKRTPYGEMSGQRLMGNRDTGTLHFFNQSVLDIKKAILILEHIFIENRDFRISAPEKLAFYICGLSLGGMISVIAMAWEKKIKKGILIQCGGNWDTIYWNSLLRLIMHGSFIKKEKIKREQARKFYLPIHDFIKKYKSFSPEDIDYELSEYPELSEYMQKTWFLSDPLTFAHRIDTENILMIASKFDLLFCRDSTLQLWNELGRPEIHWLNNLHTSRVLASNRTHKTIFGFLSDD